MMLAEETAWLVERVEAGGVFGVRDGEVVGVKDEELGVGRVAEALGDGLGLGREVQGEQRQSERRKSCKRGSLGEPRPA